MIESGRYDWVGATLNDQNFSVQPAQFITEGLSLVEFERRMSTDDLIRQILKSGRQPGTIEGLFAYGRENPDAQRHGPIVVLGSFCTLGGRRHFPFLFGDGTARRAATINEVPGPRWRLETRYLVSSAPCP